MVATRFAIIDGTGEFFDDDYAAAMRMSFCSQLGYAFGRNTYQRGPSSDGLRVLEKAEAAAAQLMGRQCNPVDRLFLAGYSRGGSAALMAAEIIRQRGFHVTGLVLFDPVKMHPWDSPGGIPANVQNSLTFVRALDQVLIRTYAGTISDGRLVPRALGDWVDNPMRPGWTENVTPPSAADPTRHRLVKVAASHGALGGVGWTHVREDSYEQPMVARVTNEMLGKWGLQVNLHQGSYSKP
jgi:pimeloyl-ACP methyl ester carboxylesterase